MLGSMKKEIMRRFVLWEKSLPDRINRIYMPFAQVPEDPEQLRSASGGSSGFCPENDSVCAFLPPACLRASLQTGRKAQKSGESGKSCLKKVFEF